MNTMDNRDGSGSAIDYGCIDVEIRGLVREMNRIKGMTTTESCFGHHEEPCRIWFSCDTMAHMTNFLFYYFDCIRSEDWRIEFDVADVHKKQRNLNLILVSGGFQDGEIEKSVKELEARFKKENDVLTNGPAHQKKAKSKTAFVATITLYYNKDDGDIDTNKPQYREEYEIIRRGTQFFCPTIKDRKLLDFDTFESAITLVPKSKKYTLDFKSLMEAKAIGIKKLEDKQ